jgi:hypothetical protein
MKLKNVCRLRIFTGSGYWSWQRNRDMHHFYCMGKEMKQRTFNGTWVVMTTAAVCCFLLMPANAWALQSHGPPEGLYVHQMAHVHFFLALGYLYWDIRRSSFKGKGWDYLLKFCLLMLCWNVVAFVGHAVAGHVDSSAFSAVGGYLSARIHGPYNLQTIIFYIAKFDHLLAVPALYFLYRGMRTLYHSVERHAGEAGK